MRTRSTHGDDPRAIDASRPPAAAIILAIRRVRRAGRLREALEHVGRGLAERSLVPDADRDRAALLLERAELVRLLGDDGAADIDLRAAAAAADGIDPALRARALAMRSAIARFRGDLRAAGEFVAAARQAVDQAPDVEPDVPCLVAVERGLCGLEAGEPGAESELERANALASSGGTDRSRGAALAGRAIARRMRGDFSAARRDLDQALVHARRAWGRRSLEVAELYNERGMVGKFEGRFGRAAADYRRAGTIIAALVGEEHPDMAALLHNLAGLEHARGAFAAAEAPARRSLEIHVRTLGAGHLAVALDRSALASILDGLGRRKEAQDELGQALRAMRTTLGPRHREVAVALNNLAALAQARRDLPAAVAAYREALAIKESLPARQSPSVAITMSNLATVLRRTGDHAEARELADRAIAILTATVEPEHPALVAARANRDRLGARSEPERSVRHLVPERALSRAGQPAGRPLDARDRGAMRSSASRGLDQEGDVEELDTEGHRLSSNDDETIVTEDDTEGHRLSSNDDETIVTDADVDADGAG